MVAMVQASSYYERGLQAIRTGNADQAEWEFDAALETLLNINVKSHLPVQFLGIIPISPYPTFPWLSSLAAPSQTLAPPPAKPAETDEPQLEAPALLGPEDLQAVGEDAPSEEAAPMPAPNTAKHDVPVVFNEHVKAFLHYFKTRKWGLITQAFERASRHLPMMRKIFREKGLPEDLLNLAFIESAVNPRATSRAKAAGIWQFIPSTGRRYGMRTSWWLDERRDPEKSTRAAAEYLKTLHTMFESWPLALAAYNAGEGKIQATIQRQRTRDFWSLRLPKETRLFVPAFMAMTIISREPEQYGFSPPPEQPFEFDRVTLRHPTDFRIIAKLARTTIEELRELNPELIREATPPNTSGYTLRIPAGRQEEFLEALERIPPNHRVGWTRHVVRKGDTPATIAKRYGTDLQAVLEVNNIRKQQVLKPGTGILLPGRAAGNVTATNAGEARQATREPARPTASREHIVEKGETLARIAKAHAVSLEDLRRWNNLPRDASLRPGQTLRIHPREQGDARIALQDSGASENRTTQVEPIMKRHVVRPGDNLWNIAKSYAVSLEDLRRWNNLPRDASLRPGQELEIRAPL
jgi:membrane-bound lytic murein transglycosylase D